MLLRWKEVDTRYLIVKGWRYRMASRVRMRIVWRQCWGSSGVYIRGYEIGRSMGSEWVCVCVCGVCVLCVCVRVFVFLCGGGIKTRERERREREREERRDESESWERRKWGEERKIQQEAGKKGKKSEKCEQIYLSIYLSNDGRSLGVTVGTYLTANRSKFEPQLRWYVHIRTNIRGKCINLRISPNKS